MEKIIINATEKGGHVLINAMNIKLRFDCYLCEIYIPDGYIFDLEKLKKTFLDWMELQPECIVNFSANRGGYCFNEKHFLKYVNDIILKGSREKAYFLQPLQEKSKSKFVIDF